jgi:hypothetical protein
MDKYHNFNINYDCGRILSYLRYIDPSWKDQENVVTEETRPTWITNLCNKHKTMLEDQINLLLKK